MKTVKTLNNKKIKNKKVKKIEKIEKLKILKISCGYFAFLMWRVFDFWFEVFDQKLVMIDDCIIFLAGNNRIECQNGVKGRVSVFDFIFDQKLTMKDDYDWFLNFFTTFNSFVDHNPIVDNSNVNSPEQLI